MLIPDLSLVLAITAMLLVLVNCLFIWSVWRRLQEQLDDLRAEARVNYSAAYGLTRHIRRIQVQLDQVSVQRGPAVSFAEADKFLDEGFNTLELADELGVSQNEAEIISHMKPARTRMSNSP